MKSNLELMLQDAVQELFRVSGVSISIEHPELIHGDYATNAALVVAKKLGKNPQEIANAIADFLRSKNNPAISTVAVAGVGFINITLSQGYLATVLASVLEEKEQWGSNMRFKGKKILIEHSSPNLFKPFHVGHMMNNAIGESIVRLARFSGATVTAISYPSDVSLGIGKAVWALLLDSEEKLEQLQTVQEKIAYLGDCYVRGTRAYEDDEQVQQKVRDITKQLYESSPGVAYDAYETAKKINLDYFLGIVGRLGSYFDGGFIFESEAGVAGVKIVKDNTPSIFENSEGAVIYRGEQDGLHTRVFMNKEGYPTYEAKDIGLLSLKFARYQPDISILVTDHEQSGYYSVVLSAGGKINPDWKEKTVHRTHGRMSFKGQKMSSRLGGVPTAEAILNAVAEEIKERSSELSADTQDMIAIGALKFVILRTMAGKNINFDPETSLSFEGDSGPYLQYSAVRANSVIEKAGTMGVASRVQKLETVTEVERMISRFPDVVTHATTEWAPHYVVSYLLELAQSFNTWYGNTKIIDEHDADTQHRLAVTSALAQTIKNGLWLLGISVPEKM